MFWFHVNFKTSALILLAYASAQNFLELYSPVQFGDSEERSQIDSVWSLLETQC